MTLSDRVAPAPTSVTAAGDSAMLTSDFTVTAICTGVTFCADTVTNAVPLALDVTTPLEATAATAAFDDTKLTPLVSTSDLEAGGDQRKFKVFADRNSRG